MGSRERHSMGRRKIDIAYLPDDRVRKVTFCKRKGGLFKKADDLSKLCGVEVAVIILSDNKTCDYASTDVSRILSRYQALQAGDTAANDMSETQKLWSRLESQRRELENLTRQLADERRIVEELRLQTSMAVRPLASDIAPAALPQNGVAQLPPGGAHFLGLPAVPKSVSPVIMAQPARQILTEDKADTEGDSSEAAAPTCCEGEDDASDDTAELESPSEDTEEPACKRHCVHPAIENYGLACV